MAEKTPIRLDKEILESIKPIADREKRSLTGQVEIMLLAQVDKDRANQLDGG